MPLRPVPGDIHSVCVLVCIRESPPAMGVELWAWCYVSLLLTGEAKDAVAGSSGYLRLTPGVICTDYL